ncbi:hypothetical protein A2U01_0032519 [Trifolium medium]|uniref:Uncharacterized protein n=1 Tax=Trifolium medium TaxID=97028 RepID=A0A392PIV1_9FABA|nr:hypothetical protein [Trifolium medium]
MKTISEEQLQAFILKAKEKKSRSQATVVPDPLSQLVVDDPASRGSKRKNQEETVRISIEVPKKGEDATAEGDTTDALVNPAKKKRAMRSNTGRSLLQGGSTQNLPAGSDAVAQEDAEVVADNVTPKPNIGLILTLEFLLKNYAADK